MESIAPKERFIECRLCGNSVSSTKPVCQKCGLKASSAGIEELAELEEQNLCALNDAYNLRMAASFSLFFSMSNCIYYLIHPTFIWYNLPLWVSYTYFIWIFVRWHRRYSKLIFPIEYLSKIQSEKNNAFILIFCSFVFGFAVIFFFG